jgi:hypothetical protein
MTIQTYPESTLKGINVQTPAGDSVPLLELLSSDKNTFVHFQNSHRKGQSCTIAMPIIEGNLEKLSALANVLVMVRETPFDEYVDTPVSQFIMSKSDLGTLGVLGEDGYIKRTSLILDCKGKILATLPVDPDRLEVYFTEEVLPLLESLKTQA